ncbi:YrhK family protein [Marinobacter halotolerans]|uniref:YrhK family protein n=1 Tax=Marinobacter halotolerans TaxID=1569211 RepID=UPI0012492A05|nr:YrhK family protein [Marinobacter halotolerans]
MSQRDLDHPLTLTVGNEKLVIRRRYEVMSIINDFIIALWFLVGSILFLFPEYERAAIWFFIIGSFQFLVRPSIRLASYVHIKQVPSSNWEY